MQEELYGAPWTIKNIIEGLSNKKVSDISNSEKLQIILEHLNLVVAEKGEYVGVREMRKHICWYLKNLKDSSKVREEINKLETKEEVEKRLMEYFNSLENSF